jgi:methylthioribose-1-phosphate isomerase
MTRASQPVAAQDATERITLLRDDIAANRVPGGSAFARAAAELIALTAEKAGDDHAAVRSAIIEAADWVTLTKPSMAVVRNVAAIGHALANRPEGSGALLAANVSATMRRYIAESERAIARIGELASTAIRPDSRVLVHSYSGSLEALLRTAAASIPFELHVTESRPYRESRRLIEAIQDSDVSVTFYSDAAVAIAVSHVDVAIVGADTIFADGSFANKTGSLPLALSCVRADVPLYVASELSKVYPGPVEDIQMELRPADELASGWPLIDSGRVRVWNQFFERVGSEFVEAYMTEVGLVAPSQMAQLAARQRESFLRTWPGPDAA